MCTELHRRHKKPKITFSERPKAATLQKTWKHGRATMWSLRMSFRINTDTSFSLFKQSSLNYVNPRHNWAQVKWKLFISLSGRQKDYTTLPFLVYILRLYNLKRVGHWCFGLCSRGTTTHPHSCFIWTRASGHLALVAIMCSSIWDSGVPVDLHTQDTWKWGATG